MHAPSLFRTSTLGSAIVLAMATAPLSAFGAAADTRTPEAIDVQVALERVCLPLLKGKTVNQVARPADLKHDDSGWYLAMPGAERLSVQPPGGANPTVCSFKVTYPVDRPQPILALLNLWAKDHHLTPASVARASTGPAEQRKTWSWQGRNAGAALAVVFDTEKTLDGRPVGGSLDRATVLVSRQASA